MKIRKILSLGVLALGVSLFSSACGLFETEGVDQTKDPNYRDMPSQRSNPNEGVNDNGIGTITSTEGPTVYGEPGVVNEYGDFGVPIPGVKLEPVYFAFDQSSVGRAELSKIYSVAEYLISAGSGVGVVVQGHCDSRGSLEYNRVLGEKRAISVKLILMEQGIAEHRIQVISYGEERPAVLGENETAWAKNRRAEFVAVKLSR